MRVAGVIARWSMPALHRLRARHVPKARGQYDGALLTLFRHRLERTSVDQSILEGTDIDANPMFIVALDRRATVTTASIEHVFSTMRKQTDCD